MPAKAAQSDCCVEACGSARQGCARRVKFGGMTNAEMPHVADRWQQPCLSGAEAVGAGGSSWLPHHMPLSIILQLRLRLRGSGASFYCSALLSEAQK